MIGRRKAAVLPVPVIAHPSTSFPVNTAGMLSSWISVGYRKSASLRDFRRGLQISEVNMNSLKSRILIFNMIRNLKISFKL